jgi:hypothetical protein
MNLEHNRSVHTLHKYFSLIIEVFDTTELVYLTIITDISKNKPFMTSSLFWDVTHHWLVVHWGSVTFLAFPYITTHLMFPALFFDCLTLGMGPIGCPETPVTNYQSTSLIVPQNLRSVLQCHRSLQTRKLYKLCKRMRCTKRLRLQY